MGVAARDHYAFIGNGGLFQALDISNPESPEIIGEVEFGGELIFDISLSGSFAYVAAGYMVVIDISNPHIPRKIATLNISDDFALVVTISGNYAFIGTARGFLVIVDISEPSSPLILSSLILSSEFIRVLAVFENYVYAKGDHPLAPIDIVDVTDPSNPAIVGAYQERTNAFTVADHYLYLSAMDSSFQILDLNTPVEPVLLSRVKVPFVGYDMKKVESGLVYVIADSTLLAVMDVSDVSKPFLVSSTSGHPAARPHMDIISNLVLATTGKGFWVIDVSQIDAPSAVIHFTTGNTTLRVKILGHFAFLNTWDGLFIVDISEAEQPTLLTHFSTGGAIFDFILKESLAFTISIPFGGRLPSVFSVIDIATPSAPRIISQVDYLPECSLFSSTIDALEVSEQFAYISHTLGFSIVDISDKLRPQFVSLFQTNISPIDIAVAGHFVCLADGSNGLRIIDVSNPENPLETDSYAGSAVGVATRNDTVFAALDEKLTILKISSTGVLTKVGEVSTPGPRSSVDIALNGHYLYMVYPPNLILIDISNPANPQVVDHVKTPTGSFGVAVSEDKVYVAAGSWALLIYQNKLVTSVDQPDVHYIPNLPKLYPNYPNPFNEATAIEYELPRRGFVELKVFNLLGEEIITLVNGQQSPGQHRVILENSELPSGLYIYLLKFDDLELWRKMIIIR